MKFWDASRSQSVSSFDFQVGIHSKSRGRNPPRTYRVPRGLLAGACELVSPPSLTDQPVWPPTPPWSMSSPRLGRRRGQRNGVARRRTFLRRLVADDVADRDAAESVILWPPDRPLRHATLRTAGSHDNRADLRRRRQNRGRKPAGRLRAVSSRSARWKKRTPRSDPKAP